MDFEFTDEQKLLSETLRKFLNTGYSFDAREKIMKSAAGSSERLMPHGRNRFTVSTAKMAFLWMGLQRNGFTITTAPSFAAWMSAVFCSFRSRSSFTRSRL